MPVGTRCLPVGRRSGWQLDSEMVGGRVVLLEGVGRCSSHWWGPAGAGGRALSHHPMDSGEGPGTDRRKAGEVGRGPERGVDY